VTLLAISDWFQGTVLSGSLLLALPVAAVAGLVSFFSPCVVPLLPGYLSYATGLSGADLASARRGRMVLGSALFVMGFSFVFVALGTLSGALGDFLWESMRPISIVLGVVTIVLGLAFLGLIPFPGCTRSPPSAWPQPRCSGCCSGWAGRRASAPRSPRSRRWRSTRAPRAAARC
jgi:cytochrome c-type biogenesis protein